MYKYIVRIHGNPLYIERPTFPEDRNSRGMGVVTKIGQCIFFVCVNPFSDMYSNICVRKKINFNLYFDLFVRILQNGVGGGDLNTCSNFTNLARYPFW